MGGISCLGHWDRFPMVSALVCMTTYYTGPIVNHDARLLVVMIYQATILLRLIALRGY